MPKSPRQAGTKTSFRCDGELAEDSLREDADDTFGEVDELLECWQNRLTFEDLRLAEHWAKGELEFVVFIELLSGAMEGKSSNFVALFQGEKRLPRFEASQGRAIRQTVAGKNPERVEQRPYRGECLMFVESVEFMDEPERLASSFVWFEPADQLCNILTGTLYFSSPGGFKCFPRAADWESGSCPDLLPIQTNGLTDNVIKGSAEVMSAVSDHCAPDQRRWFDGREFTDVLSGIRIYVSRDKVVFVSVLQPYDRLLKVNEVLFGPFDLGSYRD
jgi:hypothetical protein